MARVVSESRPINAFLQDLHLVSRRSIIFAITFALLPLPAMAVDVLVSQLLDNPDPAVRGGQITYSIDVQNQQADTANAVTLDFPIPATTNFVSVDNPACGLSGGSVVCNFGNLLGTAAVPPGPVETVNVIIASSAATGNTVNVSATAATSSFDTNSANDTLSQNTTINDGADLTTTLAPAPDPVIAGGDVTYTATVSNNGPNDAASVQVVFQLSVNLTFVPGSAGGAGWSCSASGQQVTCTRGSLLTGASAPVITFVGQETGAVTGVITTTATVSAATGDPVPNNNVTSANVTVNTGTDVAVTIMAAPTTVIAANPVVVTLKPRNLGPFDANATQVIYTVPGTFVINGTPTGPGWLCGVAGQVITCDRNPAGPYAVGASDDITVNLTAPSPSAPTVFNHPVTISTTTAEASERMANNSDSVNVTVNPDGVDLSISKSSGPNPVAQGSDITSTISVHNNGPRNAASGTVTVTDTLPANVTFVLATGSSWSCMFASQVVTCTYNAALNNGANTSGLTVVANAKVVMGNQTLTNTAVASFSGMPGDFDMSNNTAMATVTSTVIIIDLQVSKTAAAGVGTDDQDGDPSILFAQKTPLLFENTIIYSIDIFNASSDAATGITLTDTIPGFVSGAGGTTVAVTTKPANYTCSTGSTISCTQSSGALNSGATDSFTISVTRPIFSGLRTNTAQAFSADFGDPDRNNNTAMATVTVDPIADVQLQNKTVTPNPVKAGVEATYTITVRNNGPDSAQNVMVDDNFSFTTNPAAPTDSGFTLISFSPSTGTCMGLVPGVSYTAPVPTLTCDLGTMSNGNTQTISVVIRPNFMTPLPTSRIINNTAVVTTTSVDTNAGNDSFGPVALTVIQDEIDLLINNTDVPDPVAWDPGTAPLFGDNANNDVVYDVTYNNLGPSFATGTQFVYTMTPKAGKTVRWDCDEANSPDACGTSPDICAVTGGANPVTGPATLTLTCSIGDFAAGAMGERFLHFRILSAPDGTGDTHATNAVISANEQETNLANNAEAETTSVRGRVDLQVSKTASPASVQLTEPLVWTINVTNNGPSPSDQTDLSDTLPAGMRFFGATPSWINATDSTSGACTVAGSALACNLGSMTSGAIAVVSVPVLIDSFTGASVQNCATAITNGVDLVPGNSTNICGTVSVTNSFFPSDLGDAPDTTTGTGPVDYQTTLLNGGARHTQPGGTWLGGCVDADGPGTQQDIGATADDLNAGTVQAGTCSAGDDEDGVQIPALIAGQTATLVVSVSGATCLLDGWIDYNADGDWNDAGEQVFTSQPFNVGTNNANLSVPAGISVGVSYARFRCSTGGGLLPTGDASGGEVEDYAVSLQPDAGAVLTPTDYGDAPDAGIGTTGSNYQTLPVDDGASHVLGVANSPFLGSCVDSDPVTQQNLLANADDLGAAGGVTPVITTGTCASANDDEDGVSFTAVLEQGLATSIDVTASSGTNACMLNAWIDYNADGDFVDAGEQIASDFVIVSGVTATLTPIVPATAITGFTYTRFRCNSVGGLGSTGAATDGEVEDYRVEIRPNLSITPADFGDAPDTTGAEAVTDYSTVESSNGPSHRLGLPNAPYLGQCVDSDGGSAQNLNADADDTNVAGGLNLTVGSCAVANEDEDGVVFIDALHRGAQGRISVTTAASTACTLNGWLDFNQDGSFNGPGEQVLADVVQAAGSSATYSITVPGTAILGDTYARFRCSSLAGLGPVGPAPDGEVEDYLVSILRPVGIPSLSDWSRWLLMMMLAAFAMLRLRGRSD